MIKRIRLFTYLGLYIGIVVYASNLMAATPRSNALSAFNLKMADSVHETDEYTDLNWNDGSVVEGPFQESYINQQIFLVSLNNMLMENRPVIEYPLVYAIHPENDFPQDFDLDSEDEPNIESTEDAIERPILDTNTPTFVILPNSAEDDSENDSMLPEEIDPLLAILDFSNLLALGDKEDFRRFDIPDFDPVLNSLEGDNGDEAEVSSDEPESLEVVENVSETEDVLNEMNAVPDINVYTNKRIEAFVRLYTVKKRSGFELAIQRSAKYMGMINRIFAEYELPPNLAYLAIVESNFNPNARSRANAVGLWQFMSYTGKVFDLNRSWWHDDRYDPEKSTVAAAKYLKQLHKRFNGDWELAMAAYNSGGGTVRRAIRRAKKARKSTDYWSLRLPRETRGYVPAFYAVATIFSNLEAHGFKPAPPLLPETGKQPLMVPGGISLKQIAGVLDLDQQQLAELNPCLRLRGLTPASLNNFEISIPESIVISDDHRKKLAQLATDRHEDWKIHRVSQGETLWSISRYYQIPIGKILAFNRLKRKNLINIGQKLMLPVPTSWLPLPKKNITKIAKIALDKLPGITYIHVVKKGETLWRISTKYKISIDEIRRWNRKLLNRRYLKVGAELVLKLPVTLENST